MGLPCVLRRLLLWKQYFCVYQSWCVGSASVWTLNDYEEAFQLVSAALIYCEPGYNAIHVSWLVVGLTHGVLIESCLATYEQSQCETRHHVYAKCWVG